MKRNSRNFLEKFKKHNMTSGVENEGKSRFGNRDGKPFASRPFTDRKSKSEGNETEGRRSFGDNKSGSGTRTFTRRPFAARRPFDSKRPFGSAGRFGAKPFDRKPFGDKSDESTDGTQTEAAGAENRKSFAPRRFGERRPFGNRGFSGDRASGNRSFNRRPFGDKSTEGSETQKEGADSKLRRSFGEKRSFGDRKPRSFGDRKPFGNRESGDRKPFERRRLSRREEGVTNENGGGNGDFKAKKVKMVNTSTRFTVRVDRTGLWKGDPHPSLTKSMSKTGGRNNKGRITCRHMGGGAKKKYRMIDFRRNSMDGINATVERLEYDPNRSCFIALIKYENGIFDYILAPHGLKAGMVVCSGENVNISIGNALPLKNIPDGTLVHNIELKPGAGGVLARSAGSSASVCGRETGFVIIAMPSGFKKSIPSECRASIGELSNKEHMNIVFGTAGAKRHLGIRPENRGVALNPVDHPHGGRGRAKTRTNHTGRVKHGQKTKKVKNHF